MSLKREFMSIWIVCFCLLISSPPLIAEVGDKIQATAADTRVDMDLTEETARDRELSVEEDPLIQEQEELIEESTKTVVEPGEVNFYGSIRIRYRDTGSEIIWGDGGSRFGLKGSLRFKPDTSLIGLGELGVELLDKLDLLFNRGGQSSRHTLGDNLSLRLLYFGLEHPNYTLTAGKNWSAYYRVSSFTDRFQGLGANASGTFNAGTDGGNTGTGRADRVLQARISLQHLNEKYRIKNLSLDLQLQHGEPIPQVEQFNYKTTFGLSSVLESDWGLAVGLAYNHANIDENDLSALTSSGLSGDAQALVLGVRWYNEDWYLGALASRLKNHEVTDKGIYFDGKGWELYGQRRVYKRWWVVAGWNALTPDSNQLQAGKFKIDYGILGLRYSIRQFRQMLFANIRLNSDTGHNGSEADNVYTIGLRMDLP